MRQHMSEMTAQTDATILDAQRGNWWLIDVGPGRTYGLIIDWKRAYGRVDWIVRLYGDDADSTPLRPHRFIRQEDPPGHVTQERRRIELPTQKRADDHWQQHENHSELRNQNDPMAHALRQEPERKRRRRRA